MALLLDIFGFLSVVLRGLVLTAQSLTIGGIVFLALLASPLRREIGASGDAVFRRCCRLLLWSASAFARFGLIAAAAAALTAALVRRSPAGPRFAALPVLALVMLLAQSATSHAAAQLTGRAPLLLADLVHMAAAGAWIGGIPYLLLALGQTSDGRALARIGRRFSLISM